MKIILLNNSDKFVDLKSQLVPATKKMKIQNGLKKFGLFFGLALASVFIPVLHFVLVPAFLIISAVSFFYGYRVEFQVSEPSAFNCFECSKELVLPLLIGSNRRLNCTHCTAQYRIES